MVKPLITALTELQSHSTVHRAIRPTNLYWMDRKQTKLVLGDCTTVPPAFDQPVVCETIESGMALPEGRGPGYYPDDMYALGVTLGIVALGRSPRRGVDPNTLVRDKVMSGSYPSLFAEERVPLQLIELVRGLTIDEEDDRWSLESIELWQNGRRMPTAHTKQDRRSMRPFIFKDVEYAQTRQLAYAMSQDWEAAAVPIMEEKVETWLRRGLELPELADAVASQVKTAKAAMGGAKDPNQNRDVAICNVLSMLDPKAPVRFRDFRINPDALGISLAVALAQKKDVRPFVEVVLRDVMKIWIASQEQHQAEYNQYSAELRDLKTYLGQATKGGGIERCLYEVNESLGCRSPLVRNEAVLEMSDLLPALERVAGKKIDRKIWPIDRHIAAFIVARFPRDTMAQIHSLNDRDPKRSALGMLGLLAVLQWKMGPEAVPGLASWIGGLMSPVIESYHSRERRRRLEKEVPKVVRKGNLPELYNLLDNGEERQSDHDEFAAAREEYRQAAQQIAALESGNYTVSEASQKLGQQTASSLSVAAAVITLVFVVLSTLV
ncbi:MAG: protein kinase family protein [Rhodospirillaceae bacterium]